MRLPLALFAVAFSAVSLHAQTTWTNDGNDSLWTTSANWSNNVPTTTTAVTIGTQPTDDIIGVDTGNAPTIVGSFTFGSGLTAPVEISALFSETLQVNGAIANADNSRHTFSLPVLAGASATYAGGSGGLTFSSLLVGANTISTTGSITINTLLSFDLNSTSAYGQIGLVNVTGATIQINIGLGYVAQANDTFDFAPNASSNAFTGATFDASSLPALGGGLSWDTSKFLSQGTITVVPEPSTWGLFGLSLLIVAVLLRRQQRSRARLATLPVRR